MLNANDLRQKQQARRRILRGEECLTPSAIAKQFYKQTGCSTRASDVGRAAIKLHLDFKQATSRIPGTAVPKPQKLYSTKDLPALFEHLTNTRKASPNR